MRGRERVTQKHNGESYDKTIKECGSTRTSSRIEYLKLWSEIQWGRGRRRRVEEIGKY